MWRCCSASIAGSCSLHERGYHIVLRERSTGSKLLAEAIAATPVSGRIGAQVTNIRVGGDLDPEIGPELRAALRHLKVVFLSGPDHLDDAAHQASARALGTPAGGDTIRDNRATQHYAIDDHDGAHRVMRRVTLAGETPRAPDGYTSRAISSVGRTPSSQGIREHGQSAR